MNERDLQEELINLLECNDALEAASTDLPLGLLAQSFDSAGVMTGSAGLVLTLRDGSEFQITIVQSREAR